MQAELIGTFPATADDRSRVVVRVSLAFHKDPAAAAARQTRWVPDPHPTLYTEDGRRVDRMKGEPERYLIAGTATVLTPAAPTAPLYAQHEARRTAAVRGHAG